MFFSIKPTSDVPIYEQIIRQVKLAVADGTLAGGQMLPSVRQLSKDIALNPNTIARAYRDLQTQEILKPLRGKGMVVRRDAIEVCQAARDDLFRQSMRAAIQDALGGGLSREQVRQLFEDELSQPLTTDTRSTESQSPASPETPDV